jgi:hypothetical protein
MARDSTIRTDKERSLPRDLISIQEGLNLIKIPSVLVQYELSPVSPQDLNPSHPWLARPP